MGGREKRRAHAVRNIVKFRYRLFRQAMQRVRTRLAHVTKPVDPVPIGYRFFDWHRGWWNKAPILPARRGPEGVVVAVGSDFIGLSS